MPMFFRRLHSGMVWLLLLITAPAAALVPAPDDLREKGIRHASGEGGTQDHRRAYKLFCLAALEGDSRAAYHLGSMYLKGLGRKADKARAAGWLKQAQEMGDPDAGAVLEAHLASVSPADDPKCPLVNPQPDRQDIATWVRLLAPYYKIDPGLVLSIIKVESDFNARAKSPQNAFGLMQLIGPTAERFNVEDVWDPLQNLKGGMAYLAWLSDHFRYSKGRNLGRLTLVLAAYNAGEEAVKRYGRIPPYDETRTYVRRVVHIYSNYIKARNSLYRSSGNYARGEKARSRGAKAAMTWNREFRTR